MSIPVSFKAVLFLAIGLSAVGCTDGPAPVGIPESVDAADAAEELEAGSQSGEPGKQETTGDAQR